MRSAVFRLFLTAVTIGALIALGFMLIAPILRLPEDRAAGDAADDAVEPPPPKAQPHLTGLSAPAGTWPAYVRDAEGAPDRRVPISLELIDEGLDAQGTWYQTIRVSVELYGALSYVSLALYDDADHIDELYDLARKQNPKVTKPELIFVGMTFDVPVDPTRTYVIQETKTAPDGTKTRVYFNGVVEKLYPARDAIVREVLTPPGDRTNAFHLSGMDGASVAVPPGQKLVLYQHVPSAGIRTSLKRIYGTPSYRALQDFLKQIDLAHGQGLRAGDRFQLVVDMMRSWNDAQPARGVWLVDDPAARKQYEQTEQKRRAAGIHLAEVGTTFSRFLVGVYDPKMTAKDVARLLYGREDHYDHLIDLAGLWPKSTTPGADPDEKVPLPEGYNPSLFGHPVVVKVDLADEFFVWQQQRIPTNAQTESVLVNGTRVIETIPLARDYQGIQRVITYPSGRSKVQYRPNGLTMTLLDGAVFVSQLFLDPPITIDPTNRQLNAKLRVLRERRLTRVPALVWAWDPDAPREFGRKPVEVGWALGQEGQVVEVTLLPEDPASLQESFLTEPGYVRVLLLGGAAGIIAVVLILIAFSRASGYSRAPLR